MALTVNTKYSGQRLDHVDLRDVAQTTFAKGVITDVQKTADDPIGVIPMVKVSLDDQEFGDYLPLFYHPKAQYWDGDGVLAQDYDSANKYFKRAWMSFRGDDEVVVMLKEGRPAAVLGFADGKPRIGEDIIRVEFPLLDPAGDHFFHLQCSNQSLYGDLDEEKNGPDGLDLGLTEEHAFVNYGGYYQHPANPLSPNTSGDSQDWIECGIVGGDHWEAWHHILEVKYHYHEFCVPVGPLLYIFQVYWEQYISGTSHSADCDECAEIPGHWEPIPGPGGNAVMDYAPACLGPVTLNESWMSVDIQCRVGLYSQELIDAIAGNNVTATAVHDARAASEPWGTEYADTYLQSWDLLAVQSSMMAWNKSPNWAEAIFKVRPHDG